MSERPCIEVSPAMLFGQPHLSGHRLSAQMIAERYWDLGHELQTELLDFYEITRADVLVSCFWMATHGTRTWRRRWADWLTVRWAETHVGAGFWAEDWSILPLPPTRADEQAAKAITKGTQEGSWTH